MSHSKQIPEDYKPYYYPKKNGFLAHREKDILSIEAELEKRGYDPKKVEMVLGEKVHGACCSAIITFECGFPNVKFGRRNGFVPEDAMVSFYNIRKAFQPHLDNIIELAKSACYEQGIDYRREEGCCVICYFEIYGKNIQPKMEYNPSESVVLFDIRIDNYMFSFDSRTRLCEMHKVPSVPVVMMGTLDELVRKFDVEDMTSLIPKNIHHSSLTTAPAEGVVMVTRYLSHDLDNPDEEFLSFKWKKKEYLSRPPPRTALSEKEKSNLALLEESVLDFLQPNRLNSYRGKVGDTELKKPQDMGKHIRHFCNDAIDAIKKDPDYSALTKHKKIWSRITRKLGNKAGNMIREFIKDAEKTAPSPVSSKVIGEKTDDELLDEIDRNMAVTREHLHYIRNTIHQIQSRVEILSS